ncbi:MAG TPA: aminotransferase class IV [Phycisphaerae bacterium]|nr:aminotransferase class IV [Phycisphaerae bacterium]
MPELAYVNGTFCDLADAKVSIEDRGFQFADGVYEVVVAFGRRLFCMEEHLSRLANSLRGIDLDFDPVEHRIEEVVAEGVARAGFDETMVYLQITRGACSRGLAVEGPLRPTVVATFKAKPVIDAAVRERGLSVITVPDNRWARCYIKSIALLPNALARNDARRRGYDDAIFIGPDGQVREATAANVFVVRGGILVTPPKTDVILHGVTRSCVLECAAQIDLPHTESPLTADDLAAAAELFLSSTTMDFIGATRLNDSPIGDGRVGPVTRALFEQFQKGMAAFRERASSVTS